MFKNSIDSAKTYSKDRSNLYGSVISLPKQIQSTWDEMETVKVPNDFSGIRNVLLVGMGGSALGARVATTLLESSLKVPFVIVNDYHLPAFVNETSLVILSSYSGNTEEVLNAADETEKTKAKVMVIATSGKLREWAEEKQLPLYVMQGLVNPSNQPRMAIGHSVMAVLAYLSRLGLVDLTKEKVSDVVNLLGIHIQKWQKEVETKDNQAKRAAEKLLGKGVVLVSSRHLRGAVHVFKNQLNENAKIFAASFDLPELDHHMIEGLVEPAGLKDKMVFMLFDSGLYEEPIKKRLGITEEIIHKQGYQTLRVMADGKDEFEQVWEVILFGEFVAFYLALLEGFDPSPIPMVDYLKERMK